MSVNHLRVEKVQNALSGTLDLVCVAGAFAATSSIASLLSRFSLFTWPKPTFSDIAAWPAQYVVLLLSTLIAWNLVSGYLGLHKTEQLDRSSNYFGRLVRAG